MIRLDRGRIDGMAEVAAWALGRRRRIRVVGDSMAPTLTAGQFVLVDPRGRPEPGRLVVAAHPNQSDVMVVKRVEAITPDGALDLRSDNPAAGTDSRTWGPIPAAALIGTVTLLLDSPSRTL
jgi:nickel-type superoxide dismutase maturation protease